VCGLFFPPQNGEKPLTLPTRPKPKGSIMLDTKMGMRTVAFTDLSRDVPSAQRRASSSGKSSASTKALRGFGPPSPQRTRAAHKRASSFFPLPFPTSPEPVQMPYPAIADLFFFFLFAPPFFYLLDAAPTTHLRCSPSSAASRARIRARTRRALI